MTEKVKKKKKEPLQGRYRHDVPHLADFLAGLYR